MWQNVRSESGERGAKGVGEGEGKHKCEHKREHKRRGGM